MGGQTELMLQGVRVGNLRQLANQYEPETLGILARLLSSFTGDKRYLLASSVTNHGHTLWSNPD